MKRSRYVELMDEGGFFYEDEYQYHGKVNTMLVWQIACNHCILLVIQPTGSDRISPENDIASVELPNEENSIQILIAIKDMSDNTEEAVAFVNSLKHNNK